MKVSFIFFRLINFNFSEIRQKELDFFIWLQKIILISKKDTICNVNLHCSKSYIEIQEKNIWFISNEKFLAVQF